MGEGTRHSDRAFEMGKRSASVQHFLAGSIVGKRQSRTKYGNRKVAYDGYKFDSKRECDRYKELRILEAAGKITELKIQPKFQLRTGEKDIKIRSGRYPNGRRVAYFADFSYMDDYGLVIEDVKGQDTPVSKLKRAIVEAQYGIPVTLVR